MISKTKTITMVLLVAIAAVGAIGIGIGTLAQSAQAFFGDETGHGQSELHDGTGDLNSNLHSNGHGKP